MHRIKHFEGQGEVRNINDTFKQAAKEVSSEEFHPEMIAENLY